jgi:hypothetical protein
VLWEKLDRILEYDDPTGGHALRGLEAMSEAIAEHLAMVFHRFLAGETTGRRRLKIRFNGDRLKSWDPFARLEPATQTLPEQRLAIELGAKKYGLRVRPYILPSQVHFSSVDGHLSAAGPKKWNRQQGFYIYRGDRLIQSGGWNRLRTMDEHSKLARIALDVPVEVEERFQINVAKMRVVIPEEARPQLRALAAGVVNAAQEAYRRHLRLVGDGGDGYSDASFESEAGAWSLGDVWPVVAEIVSRELRNHPELLNRILLALANARPASEGKAVAVEESA